MVTRQAKLFLTTVLCAAISMMPVSLFAGTTKKWYPGHYIYAYDGSIEEWEKTKEILDKAGPHFKGYVVRHDWRDLEPRKDVYDFSVLKTQLDKAHSEGRQIQVFIDERRYGTKGSEPPDCVPDYMMTDPIYEGGQYKLLVAEAYSKTFARLWVTAVAERYGALLKALGAELDKHPALAVIIQAETALQEAQSQTGFTSQRMIDGRLTISKSAAEAFPTTIFNVIVNARGGIVNDDVHLWFDPHVTNYKHSFGAPNPATTKREEKNWKDTLIPYGYGYEKYKNIAPIVMQFQNNWDFLSPKEFIDHMVSKQNVHMIGWHRKTSLEKTATFLIYDVIDQVNTPNYVSYISNPPSNIFLAEAESPQGFRKVKSSRSEEAVAKPPLPEGTNHADHILKR